MRIVIFCHSLISDWNHGNAHFLRGIVTELKSRRHDVAVYEPADAWSVENLVIERGPEAREHFRTVYPGLDSIRYAQVETLDLDQALDGADLVLVHEWNAPELVGRIGRHRARVGTYQLLFHDTHHRIVSDPASMAAFDLSHYDGVLAFGNAVQDHYKARGWGKRVWTWHEAADTRVFYPRTPPPSPAGDLVWIGNWGDEERTEELKEFLLEPVHALGLKARVHGVRYPAEAKQALQEAGIEYAGWLPNYEASAVFASYKVTVHVPRRPYRRLLPGIPTIRVFETLACGIPLVSAPWDDTENLFTPGEDFLVARDGQEMQQHLRFLIDNPDEARSLAARGRETILRRHTCAHRVDELLGIYDSLCEKPVVTQQPAEKREMVTA